MINFSTVQRRTDKIEFWIFTNAFISDLLHGTHVNRLQLAERTVRFLYNKSYNTSTINSSIFYLTTPLSVFHAVTSFGE